MLLQGLSCNYKVHFVTARWRFLLQGTTCYYKVRFATPRYGLLLQGTFCYCHVKICDSKVPWFNTRKYFQLQGTIYFFMVWRLIAKRPHMQTPAIIPLQSHQPRQASISNITGTSPRTFTPHAEYAPNDIGVKHDARRTSAHTHTHAHKKRMYKRMHHTHTLFCLVRCDCGPGAHLYLNKRQAHVTARYDMLLQGTTCYYNVTIVTASYEVLLQGKI